MMGRRGRFTNQTAIRGIPEELHLKIEHIVKNRKLNGESISKNSFLLELVQRGMRMYEGEERTFQNGKQGRPRTIPYDIEDPTVREHYGLY